jgi:hypothetical protein
MTLLKKVPFLLLPALLSSCSVSTPRAQTPTPPAQHSLPPTPQTPAIAPKITPPPPSSPKHPVKIRTASLNGTTFTAVTFDRRDYFLKVVDQKGGPGSQFESAESAGKGGLAAINGGFFTPEGKPLGLVIAGGEARGSFNSDSFLGTGILDGKKVTLSSRKTYQKSAELLQTGPRLVWPNEILTGLSSDNDRPRSFLIWDGKNHFGLVHASSATLQGLSNNLKSQPIPGFDIQYAVNLDGGTSCDLWVAATIPGGGLTKKSFFNKKARNYLVLRKR